MPNHTNLHDFSGYSPTWCPGCGNWGIGRAIKQSLSNQGLEPSQVAMMFDVGCSGNMNDFVNAYAMHTLHGRSIANAVGVKLANHTMPVVVVGGDGALYGEGGNHLLHACRGNHDLTVIVHDNSVYGLTTGQVSPTSKKGQKGKSTPHGVIEQPLNSLLLTLTQGATFVAQSFANDINHLTEMMTQGMAHTGLSIINVLQPCVTFNKANGYGYFFDKVYKLDETYDASDFQAALAKAQEPMVEKFPLGVLYQVERPAYHHQLEQLPDEGLVNRQPMLEVGAILDRMG